MDGQYYSNRRICPTDGGFPDALRYFEDRGILVPERDPVNGYRYYSIDCSRK